VHTLVGWHAAGETTIALQRTSDNERTTFDRDVVEPEDVESAFWFEVVTELNGGHKHYATLSELVEARSEEEGLPPCTLVPLHNAYDTNTSHNKHHPPPPLR